MKRISMLLALVALSFPAYADSNWEISSKSCINLKSQVALDACNVAIMLLPAHEIPPVDAAKIYISRGVILGEAGRTEEALQSFQDATRIDPTSARAYYNMGVAFDDLGYTSKALRAYRKSVKLDPNVSDAWGNIGVTAYDLGRYKESAKAFQNAQLVDPAYLNNKKEQQDLFDTALGIKPPSLSRGREITLKLTPNIGYLGKIQKNVFQQFLFLMPEASIDVQIYKNWFATGSFLYTRTTNETWQTALQNPNATWNSYGITFGIKYILREGDYAPDSDSFIDRSRFWTSIEAGPYITNIDASIYYTGTASTYHRSITSTNFGFNAGIGMDYYFSPHFSAGLQFKINYVKFDASLPTSTGNPDDDAVNAAINSVLKGNDYIILGGGPSLSYRF